MSSAGLLDEILFAESNPEETDYSTSDDSITEHVFETRCKRIFSHAFMYISYFSFFILFGTILASIYGVLLIIYSIMVSVVLSFFMVPILNSVKMDYFQFTISFARIFIEIPVVQFFIIFIIKSFVLFIKTAKEMIVMMPDIVRTMTNAHKFEEPDLSYFIPTLFGTAFTTGVFYVVFFLDKLFVLPGLLYYLCIFLGIILILSPIYYYWWKVMIDGVVPDCPLVTFARKWFNNFLNHKNDLDECKAHTGADICVQTKETFFNHVIRKLDISSEDEVFLNDNYDSGSEISDDYRIQKPRDKIIEEKKFYKGENKIVQFGYLISKIFIVKDYMTLEKYSRYIAYEGTHKWARRISTITFTFLCLILLGFDVTNCAYNYSPYLLASIILRFVLFPYIAYFNFVNTIVFKPKDLLIKIVNIVSMLICLAGIVTYLVFLITSKVYNNVDKFKVRSVINPESVNFTANDRVHDNPACSYNFRNHSVFDIIGLSLGVYYRFNNIKSWENQNKFFYQSFDENSISTHYYPFNFIIYTVGDMSIFALGDDANKYELMLTIELSMSQNLIPFFQRIIPLYEYMTSYWLNHYIRFALAFGRNFFDPVTSNDLYNKIENLCKLVNNQKKTSNFILISGIKSGGTIAKIVSLKTNTPSFSFMGFSQFDDFSLSGLNLNPNDAPLITNIDLSNTILSTNDFSTSKNIKIPRINPSGKTDYGKRCTSDICSQAANTRNSIYRSFCTLVSLCGKKTQFEDYCNYMIGKNEMDNINNRLKTMR